MENMSAQIQTILVVYASKIYSLRYSSMNILLLRDFLQYFCYKHGYTQEINYILGKFVVSIFNSFAPAKIAKKNVRKVAVRKTVIINHN